MPTYIADPAAIWRETALDDVSAELFGKLRRESESQDEYLNQLRDATRLRLGKESGDPLGW